MDIASISNNVLGEASQAMDSGVYLVQFFRCPTVPDGAQQWCVSWKCWISYCIGSNAMDVAKRRRGCSVSNPFS
jgi:hypothetical protein